MSLNIVSVWQPTVSSDSVSLDEIGLDVAANDFNSDLHVSPPNVTQIRKGTRHRAKPDFYGVPVSWGSVDDSTEGGDVDG